VDKIAVMLDMALPWHFKLFPKGYNHTQNMEEFDLEGGFSFLKIVTCFWPTLGHPPLYIFLAQFDHIPQAFPSPF
jgi:hypothetical protein